MPIGSFQRTIQCPEFWTDNFGIYRRDRLSSEAWELLQFDIIVSDTDMTKFLRSRFTIDAQIQNKDGLIGNVGRLCDTYVNEETMPIF